MNDFREIKHATVYRTQRWKALRQRVLKRDGFTCTSCKNIVPKNAHVDHITPITPDNLNNEDVTFNIDNLQTLCHGCHNRKTGFEKSNKCDYLVNNEVDYEQRERW